MVCHRDIAEIVTGVADIAAVCNDGEIELMKVPLYLLQVSTRKKYKVCLCWKVKYTTQDIMSLLRDIFSG